MPSYRGTGPRKKVPSFRGNAESPRRCRELVCGKTDRIPLFSGMTVRICGMMIAIAALFATPSFATDPDPVAQKTVASKAYVDTKQDIIETGNVMLWDDPEGTEGDIYVPGLVAYDPQTSALSGNKIGILDQEAIGNDEGGLVLYSHANGHGTEMDNFVPTVRAVAEALQNILSELENIWSSMLSWSNTQSTAINAYNTTFGNGTNNWAGNSSYLINGQFLANSLALKQNKIATSGKYYNASGTLVSYNENSSNVSTSWLHTNVKGTGLVTKTATEGRVGERKIFEASDVSNYHAANLNQNQQDIQDISIPTVGAMMTAISNGANAALPTGTTGTVVTYNGTNATTGVQQFTETAISGTATYDDNDQLTNGNNIANVSLVETEIATRQKKRTCAGYETGHENDPDYCWLWNFPD